MHAAMMRGAAPTIIGQTLGNLIDYTRTHFRDEEGLMRSMDYRKYTMHKAQHDALTKRVLELKAASIKRQLRSRSTRCSSLRTWLEHHIMVLDRDIAAHVLEKSGGGLIGTGAR